MTPSLFELCQRTAIRHVEQITDIGDDMPYEMALPFLRKIRNPEQLKNIELTSPQIAGECGELWRNFIKRDIQRWQTKTIEPQDPKKWWKVYRKLKAEDDNEKKAAEQQLRAALNASKAEKATKSANIVHEVIPQGKKAVTRSYGQARPMAFGGSALKNARTGTDALGIIRRQTAHASASRHITAAVPNQELSNKRSQIQQAPQSMINAYARKNGQSPIKAPRVQPPNARNPVFAPRLGMTSARDMAINAALRREREEQRAKEQRLRALTSGNGSVVHPGPSTSSSRSTEQPKRLSPPPRTASPMLSNAGATKKRPASGIFMTANVKKVKK